MKTSLRKFTLNHTLITLFLGLIFFSLKILFPAFPIPKSIWAIFGFFYFFVFVVHWILLKSSEKRPQVFVRTFMVMTVAKLFVYLGFISIMILLNKSEAMGTLIVFAALYFVHLAHEIAALLGHLRQTENKGQNPSK